MKNSILLLLVVALLSSCSNDDDDVISPELSGTWNLVDVTCECGPVDFEVGEHVWNFNTQTSELTVSNNPNEDLQILDSGNYSFVIGNNIITILSVEYDFYFEQNKLFLGDQPESDGPLMEFVRN
jgi:hypothetical protein